MVKGIFAGFLALAYFIVMPPNAYMLSFACGAMAWASCYWILLALGPSNLTDEYRIKCKRMLAFITGAACGAPGCYGYIVGDMWWVYVGGGIQFGCYWTDMMLITDMQARIDALIFHHFMTIGYNLYLVNSAQWIVIAIALFMEVTNPFWYLNIIVRLHTKAGEGVLWYTKNLAMYSYICVRFMFVTPQIMVVTAPLWWGRSPTLDGWVAVIMILLFTKLNIDNLVKLIKS